MKSTPSDVAPPLHTVSTTSRHTPSSLEPANSAHRLGLTGPPVYAAIQRLEKSGILREATGQQRGKLYIYDE